MTIKSNKKINENSTKCEFAFTDVLLQFKTLCPIFVYRKTLKRVETNSLIGIRSFSPVGNFVLLRVGLLNKHQRGRSHLFRPVVAAVASEREKKRIFQPKKFGKRWNSSHVAVVVDRMWGRQVLTGNPQHQQVHREGNGIFKFSRNPWRMLNVLAFFFCSGSRDPVASRK